MSAVSSPCKKLPFAVFTALFLSTAAARAQHYWSADFNNQLTPAGMSLRGNAVMQSNTGVSNTACVALTPAARSMQGDVILPQIWAADEMPAEVRVRFSLKLSGNSGGTQGDGFSVSVTNGIPAVLGDEEGFLPGPLYSFDTYENAPGDGGLDIKWPYRGNQGYENNALHFFPSRTQWYSVDIHSMLHSKQQVIRVNGNTIASLPSVGTPPGIQYNDARIVMAARTGDAYNAHLVDNLSLEVTPYPIFKQQPQSQTVTSESSVIFTAQTNFNTLPWRDFSTFTLVDSVTSQWQIRHPGGNWTIVPDTTLPLLWGPEARPSVIFRNLREDRGLWEGDDPVWSITGTEVRCVLYWHNEYSVATQPAVLRVMPRPQEYPGTITSWNSFPQGSASVTFPHEEGKVLRLTPAQADSSGGFVFHELSHNIIGEPNLLESMIASFQFRGSLPTPTRADGISFNIATDIPAQGLPPAGEEGAGTGLTVSFDAFSNGPDDPTAIDVIWKGQRVARIPMPADQLFNNEWNTFYVRLNFTGTLELALNGTLLLGDLPLTNWTGIATPRLAFYGRTGSFWQQQDVRELAVWASMRSLLPFLPQLTAQPVSPGTIMLEWTIDPNQPWDLYESPDLINWTKNTAPPLGTGNTRKILYPAGVSRRFFRMQKQ